MLDLLFGTDGKVDVNAVYRPLNRKWYLIDLLFMTMARCGDHSAFTMDMAHVKGSTALHQAAAYGQTHLVEWLLEHGAKKSLSIKNKMGATPLEVARIFGPHPEVESLLSAAMLEANFSSRYKVRKGSLMAMGEASRDILRGASDEAGEKEEEEEEAATAASTVAKEEEEEEEEEEAKEEEEEGHEEETGGDAANSQNVEEGSLVVESLEDSCDDQRPTHTGVSYKESGALERDGDRDGDRAGGGAGVIASSDLATQLSALQREQEAARREQEAARREQEAKLDAVHGKLDAVLAWIATENEARERGAGGR